MKAIYNEEKRTFVLDNNNIQYLFFVDSQGNLRHLYLGKKINDFSIESMTDLDIDWARTYIDSNDEEKIYEDNFCSSSSLMEVSTNQKSDRRGSLIAIKQLDGSYTSEFKYVSHRIYENLPTLNNLPFVKANQAKAKTIEVILQESISKMELVLSFSIIENLDVILRTSKIINKDQEVTIDRAHSILLDLPKTEYNHIHFSGDWALERFVEKHNIVDGKIVIESEYGRSSHEENPLNILQELNGDEDNGETIGFNILYSGNFKCDINVDRYKTTRVLLGINDTNFDYKLQANEILELPQGVIAYSSSGLNKMSQIFADLVRNHIVRYKKAKEYRPLIFNSWEGCYFTFNTQSIIEYMDAAKEIGSELFVLDDGWFGKRDGDYCSLGDWFVNKEKIDLKAVIDHCHKLNMKFGLWFEPEMVNAFSQFYQTHPNCALGHKEINRELERHQMSLDLTNEQVIEDVAKQVCAILDEYEIDYVKWDHNRRLADSFSYNLNVDKQGSIAYLQTLGFYKLCHKIIDKYPHIMFEGCASGGGRFDLGMAYYFPQIWCSDETNPVQRLFIQYGSSIGYPLSMIGSHVSKCEITSYKTKSNVALFGTYGYEFNPTLLSDSEKEELKSNLEIYHSDHTDVILNGDLYRISSPFDSNYFSQISVSKDKKKALFIFMNFRKENNRYRFIKLRGLNPNSKYINTLDNKEYYGDYYMNVGLNLTKWIDNFTSFVVKITEVK